MPKFFHIVENSVGNHGKGVGNDYLFEHQHYNYGAYNITYSRKKPEIKDEEVNKVCDNIPLILKNARLNYESDKTILATIRDNQLIYDDDIDIWKDIKVWINGVYPKYQGNTLFYKKHSYHNPYLRDGENEEKLIRFYEEKNGFKRFDTKEIKSGTEDAHMLIQFLKVL